MTKSLGRTYSLLDFSGREMHYWPGNLPRRHVGVASTSTLYVQRYRALHPLVLVFQEERAAPVASSYFPPSHPPDALLQQSTRFALTLLRSGRDTRRIRTCVKSPRAFIVPADGNVTVGK